MCKCRSCWWKCSTAVQERLPAGRGRQSSPPQREHIKRMSGAAVLPPCWSQISQRKKKKSYYLSDDTFSTSWILKNPSFLKTLQAKLVKEDGFPLKLWSCCFFFLFLPAEITALGKVTRTRGLGASESSSFNNCPVTIKLMQGSGIFYSPAFVPELTKKVP